MLNPSQVRAMSVALQLTEEAMDRIERLLVAPAAGVTYSLVDDLTGEERKRIPALCGQVRAALEDASARVQAKTLERSRRREIRGEAATLWATLEDTTSKGLRGYGLLRPKTLPSRTLCSKRTLGM